MKIENKNILFEKGKVLNSHMLNELQENSKEYLRVKYYEYPDGIIKGLDFKYDEEKNLLLTPGIVKYKKEIYVLGEEKIIKTKEEFKEERKEEKAIISLLPQDVRLENNIEIKELKLDIKNERDEDGIFLGSFIERVGIQPELNYEKLGDLINDVYLNQNGRIYSTNVGKGSLPILGEILGNILINKEKISPIESYLLKMGLDKKSIPEKYIYMYLEEKKELSFERIIIKLIERLKDKAPTRRKNETIKEKTEERSYKKESSNIF